MQNCTKKTQNSKSAVNCNIARDHRTILLHVNTKYYPAIRLWLFDWQVIVKVTPLFNFSGHV